MSYLQFLSILIARKWVGIWVFLVTILTTLIITLIIPKTYVASASLVINTKGTDPVTGNMLPASIMPGYMATQVDIIQSRNVALKVVDKLKLVSDPKAVEKFEREANGKGDVRVWYADKFSENLDVIPSRESNVIELSYEAPDADFAAGMANAFADAYIETNLQLRVEPAKQAAEFFDKQLKSLKINIEKSQAKLSAFQQKHGITSEDTRLDIETARLNELSTQLVLAQSQTIDSQSRSQQNSKSGAGDAAEILSNPLIQGLKSQLVQAESKMADATERLGVNHPQYIAAKQDVDNIRSSINREIYKTSASMNQSAKVSVNKESEIKAALVAQKEKVLKLKNLQDELSVLLREVDGAQKIYDNAILKFGQANMESQSVHTDISILNPARPPIKHARPKFLVNIILSIVMGAILAIFSSLIMEVTDRKVRHADDLSKNLGLPVLGDLTMSDKPKMKDLIKAYLKHEQGFNFKNKFNLAKR